LGARLSVRRNGFVALVVTAATVMAVILIPKTHPSSSQLAFAAVLTVMACTAIQFPLLVTPRVKVNTSSAAYLTAALTLAPGAAVVVVGVSQLVGGVILARRRNPLTGRPRRRWVDTAFNTSQWVIATSASGLVFHSLVGKADSETTYVWFVGLVAAAVAMYALNTGLVAFVAAIQTRQPFFVVWLAGRRVDAVTETALYVVGAVASVAAPAHPWVLLGLVIPTLLLHNSLQRTLQLQRQTVAALEQMADLVDLRDGYTGQHSERVADYSQRIAKRLRLGSNQVSTIRLAARVHDIGKIAIPDRVLHKPGPLDPDEWELMKSHVEAGCRVLERFDDYADGVGLVRCHHERIDGGGYPRGLAGQQVPLGAEVIGIADAIDAMTSDRPYRKAMPLLAVGEELMQASGGQFRAEVVDAALQVLGLTAEPTEVRTLRHQPATG
jgi:HD domain-containing protein/MASE9 protein